MNLLTLGDGPKWVDAVIAIQSGPKVDDARNSIMKIWLEETTCDYLLMVDADMVLPPDIISRLVGHDKDVVGALAFSVSQDGRTMKPTMHVIEEDPEAESGFRLDIMFDYPRDSVVQVAGTGCACLLIKREVAEDVWKARGKDHPMPWFAFSFHNGLGIGEDIAFCLTAQKVGYTVWVDTGVCIPHVKTRAYLEKDYVVSLLNPEHPMYDKRETVPAYQELIGNGDSSL